jgi:hypothetical protein
MSGNFILLIQTTFRESGIVFNVAGVFALIKSLHHKRCERCAFRPTSNSLTGTGVVIVSEAVRNSSFCDTKCCPLNAVQVGQPVAASV